MQNNAVIRRVFRLTLASYFVANLMTVLGSVIDGLIVGNTMDDAAVAAVGLVSPAVLFFSVLGTTVSVGFQDQSLASLSRGDTELAGRSLTGAFYAGTVISLIVMLVTLLFTDKVLFISGVSEGSASYQHCVEYLRGTAIGLPGMTWMAIFARGTHVEGRHRAAGIAMIATVALNLLGDLVCIELLDSGMFGIAVDTSISYYVGAAILGRHYLSSDSLIKPALKGITFQEALEVSRHGVQAGIVSLVYGLTMVMRANMINAAIDIWGNEAIGLQAYNVQVQVNYIVGVFMASAVDTMFLLAAMYRKEEDRTSYKQTMRHVVGVELISTIAISAFIYCFSGMITMLYLGKGAGAAYVTTTSVLKTYSVGLVFQMIVLAFANYIQLFSHGLAACLVYAFSNAVLPVFGLGFGRAAAVASHGNVVAGLFGGLSSCHIVTVLILPLVALVINRDVKGRDFFWMMPDSFGVPPEDELRAVITSEDEVMEFSRAAWDFCEKKGESRRLAYLTSLSVEEMANNVIKHGFKKDKKPHSLSVRIVCKDDSLILRFRDNCRGFDPRKKYESIFGNEDPGRMIGIRMIMAGAEEVRYTSMLDLNNLIIIIRKDREQC